MPIITGGGGGSVSAPVTFAGTNAATVPLTVKGAVGQSNDILDATDSTGNFGLFVGQHGDVFLEPDGSAVNLLRIRNGAGSSDWSIAQDGTMQVTPAGTGSALTVSGGVAGNVAVDGRGHLLVTPSGGSALGVQVATAVAFSQHSAPADGDLANGQCALWIDQTIGATKLMVKAKDSGGTVRTTSIALT